MNSSKAAIVVSQIIEKIEMIAGAIWGGLFFICILSCIFEGEEDISFVIACIVCFVLGVWVFYCGYRRKKLRNTFKRYVACLSDNSTGDLENLAAANGTSVDVVKKNLRAMIKKRFFSNAYLDEGNNRIVLNPTSNQDFSSIVNMTQQIFGTAAQPTAQTPTTVFVTCNCPNCGGINKVAKGTIAECDFCGSSIQA